MQENNGFENFENKIQGRLVSENYTQFNVFQYYIRWIDICYKQKLYFAIKMIMIAVYEFINGTYNFEKSLNEN